MVCLSQVKSDLFIHIYVSQRHKNTSQISLKGPHNLSSIRHPHVRPWKLKMKSRERGRATENMDPERLNRHCLSYRGVFFRPSTKALDKRLNFWQGYKVLHIRELGVTNTISSPVTLESLRCHWSGINIFLSHPSAPFLDAEGQDEAKLALNHLHFKPISIKLGQSEHLQNATCVAPCVCPVDGRDCVLCETKCYPSFAPPHQVFGLRYNKK